VTEQELYDSLTVKVAEQLTDAEYRMGSWRKINRADASEQEQRAVLYYLRMAGAALTVLVPMIAERDTQIEQLRAQLGGAPDAA
jgi:hypothetical protein